MQKSETDGTLTVKAIAGTYNVLLAWDMPQAAMADCLGFSIERTDGAGNKRWLSNMLRFPTDTSTAYATTATAPLQTFRWGDYTLTPGQTYTYRVVPRHGTPADIIAGAPMAGGVTVTVTTADVKNPDTMVFFNRGAAASKAYVDKFGDADPESNPAALTWLSRGLKEAILDFLASATGPEFGLHAVIYEFQKPELLDALVAAHARGVDVQVVYHARQKGAVDHGGDHRERVAHRDPSSPSALDDDDGDSQPASADKTRQKNEAAITGAGLDKALTAATLVARNAAPQNAIMHDKYVVRLHNGVPDAVLTGSTNWTDGALYGQLNVAHIIHDAAVAATYEASFTMLQGNPAAPATKTENLTLTPVPKTIAAIPKGITPVFSPQSSLDMIDLYAAICAKAKLLFVSAPFLLHEKIRTVIEGPTNGALRYVLADKEGSFGAKGALKLMNGDPGRVGVAATMLGTTLNDFQGKLLEGTESFHHAGVHVHTKIILADPFTDDAILVGGSANFSTGSSTLNDSNSLIVRGCPNVTDIYATEFMRMFEHYWFRFHQKAAPRSGPLGLDPTTGWQKPFFDENDTHSRDRVMFAG
jgi:phosphatidylserine/phosphatidylglycerophosphate/cardiolipin synthase-like enzyme